MKHTPGPWEKDLNYITDKNGKEIAAVAYTYDGYYMQANTCLIAAAPDLLEACKTAISAISTPGQGPKYAVKILQSAIAKVDK